jgi:hypothetical protein
MGESLELLLDTEERQCRLCFRYPSPASGPAGPLVAGSLEVESGPLRLSYRFVCFGYDLDDFAAQLGRLHAALAGEARFVNQEGSVCVTLGAAPRGRLAVRVELEQRPAEVIRLAGWAVEQSFLPGMAEAIDRFLAANGVERRHPMECRSRD